MLKRVVGCLGGGCIDFALADRVAAVILCGSAVRFADNTRRPPELNEGVRPTRPWGGSALSLEASWRASRPSSVDSIPGPMDLREPREAGFGGVEVGKWLWRRVRMEMFDVGCGSEGTSGRPLEDVLLLFRDWLKRRRREVPRGGRVSVPFPGAKESSPVFLVDNICVTGMTGGKMLTPPLPGAGKSLRVGSGPVMLV